MFREMRRIKQQVSDETCRKILAEGMRGVLAVNGDNGYPYAFPIDYVYDQDTGEICFHCAKEGYKLDALRNSDKVSFCVYDKGRKEEGDWALYITSVIVFGRIRIVEDPAEAKKKLQSVAKKYMPAEEEAELDYDRQLSRLYMLVLTPESMTGKLVHEK